MSSERNLLIKVADVVGFVWEMFMENMAIDDCTEYYQTACRPNWQQVETTTGGGWITG